MFMKTMKSLNKKILENIIFLRVIHIFVTPVSYTHLALEAHVELIPYSRFNVIEGTYSMHPYFGMFYDFTIALDVYKRQDDCGYGICFTWIRT